MSKGHVAVGSEAKEFILLHKGSRTIAVIGRYGRGIYVAHTGLDNVWWSYDSQDSSLGYLLTPFQGSMRASGSE